MKKKKHNIPTIQKPEKDLINDALFGLDEEIDSETAEDILNSYGISSEELVSDFKLLIQQELRENNGNEEKKKESENLLQVLKDISNYQRANDPKQIEPKTLIQGFLDGTMQAKLKPSFDFRNKSKDGVSENDKQILRELEEDN
jgi:hypothetical protein